MTGITLSINTPGSIKCSYFAANISTTLKICKQLKTLYACSVNDKIVQSFEAFY